MNFMNFKVWLSPGTPSSGSMKCDWRCGLMCCRLLLSSVDHLSKFQGMMILTLKWWVNPVLKLILVCVTLLKLNKSSLYLLYLYLLYQIMFAYKWAFNKSYLIGTVGPLALLCLGLKKSHFYKIIMLSKFDWNDPESHWCFSLRGAGRLDHNH